MLKILQARLQQYVNCELPDVQAGFRKGRGTRGQITNIHWIIEKTIEFQKNIYLCFIDYAKAFDCVDHKNCWRFFKRREYHTILLFNFCAEYVMRNARLDDSQAGIKIAGRNINNLRYARWYHSSGRKWRASWWKWKKRVKPSLKLNIQKTKITASCPKTSWQIEGGKVEAVTDFIFLGSKITADDDCSHEIKRHLFLGRKAMANLDSLLKSRDITLPMYCQSYGSSSGHAWMWELDSKESWVLKHWCFWTVVLEKTLESPLDSMEIKPVHPKGNQPWIFTGRTDAEAPILWPLSKEPTH